MKPNLYTVLPGQDLALLSAQWILQQVPMERLPQAVALVPNRRAKVTLCEAFGKAHGKPLLLPRIFPLADLGDELLSLFGHTAIEILATIPPAMSEWHRLSLLTAQVQLFEKKRGSEVSLDHALRLAKNLASLQDRATRAGVTLTRASLEKLYPDSFAAHWQQSLEFLSIVAETWPAIEQEQSMITQAAREIAILRHVSEAWKQTPPGYPVFAVGSTASQSVTADLLYTIAGSPSGSVILPGVDPAYPTEAWHHVRAGHPYFHIKALLDRWPLLPSEVTLIGQHAASGLWLQALAPVEQIPDWRHQRIAAGEQVRIIPCQHAEEEARVISLLLREALEQKNKKTALITPDESLMTRVAAHLQRYNITADRLSVGTLATTETGSAYAALMEAVESPELMLPLLNLLRHPLACVGDGKDWHAWRDRFENKLHGVVKHRIGQLPALPEELRNHPATKAAKLFVSEVAQLSGSRLLASQWGERMRSLLGHILCEQGEGAEPVADALEALKAADILGPIDSYAFASLLREQLSKPWREAPLHTHPDVLMLTPVEARLQHFDRVVLAGMVEGTWPSLTQPSPWLNFTQTEALGLGAPEEHVSLMAHDVLMLGSLPEVFLTYPQREAGSPTSRSRFIERLVTLLAAQGIEEKQIVAHGYLEWANALYRSDDFTPALQVAPKPPKTQRPTSLRVTELDHLFSDPFKIYVKYTLGLKKLDGFDAEPEAKDFGTLAHAALKLLTEYWNEHRAPAPNDLLDDMAQQALTDYSGRPNIQLFWQRRLRQALQFLNEMEVTRRATIDKVESEKEVRAVVGGIELHGRIDRLEHAVNGQVVIGDYKTGDIPSSKEVIAGKYSQLVAYAMMLSEQGVRAASLDYWGLPHGGKPGEVSETEWGLVEGLLPALTQAITDMLDEHTPFLARPIFDQKSSRFENEYDGISRYDEWAG